MSPVLSPVPVVWPVSRSGVAPAGRAAAGDTLTVASRADAIGLAEAITVASRADALVVLDETPAQAANQLDDALSVLCGM